MFCSKCGANVPSDFKFCGECGNKIEVMGQEFNQRQAPPPVSSAPPTPIQQQYSRPQYQPVQPMQQPQYQPLPQYAQPPISPQIVKKPLHKRVWFWLLVVFVVCIVVWIVVKMIGKNNIVAFTSDQSQVNVNSSTEDRSDSGKVASGLENKTENSVTANSSLSVTIDDVTITITNVHIVDIIGDRTKDNIAQEGGDYFAIGSDIVKTSDYKALNVEYTIDNKSDKAIGYAKSAWEFSLPDGYVIKTNTSMGDLSLKQIPSNTSNNETVEAIIESTLDISVLHASYDFMDYNQEYWDDIGKAIFGSIDQETFESKYHTEKMEFIIQVK